MKDLFLTKKDIIECFAQSGIFAPFLLFCCLALYILIIPFLPFYFLHEFIKKYFSKKIENGDNDE